MESQDHVVYLDFKAKEFELITSGKKTMIIRGAMGRKLPYGIVHEQDNIFFIVNNGEGKILGKAVVVSVMNSEKLDKQASDNLVTANQEQLQLNVSQIKRWSGKRYLVLISFKDFEVVSPFKIDRSNFGNMDDWLPVGDINKVKAKN